MLKNICYRTTFFDIFTLTIIPGLKAVLEKCNP